MGCVFECSLSSKRLYKEMRLSFKSVFRNVLDKRRHKDTYGDFCLEREIISLAKQCKNFDHFLTEPGVGLITAATMSAKLADPQVFKNRRQFAAYIGLVPQHYCS